MAKATRVKKETTRMRDQAPSRAAKIEMMVRGGLGNAAIWSAMESEYPTIIEDAKRRHEVSGDKKLAFDKDLRGKISRDINSTRGLARKADDAAMALVNASGGGASNIKRLDEIDMANRHRFSWQVPALDFIYGETRYIHLCDHPDSKYRDEEKQIKKRDEHGNTDLITIKRKIWISGTWRMGDPLIPVKHWSVGHDIPTDVAAFKPTRDAAGNLLTLDLREQIVEHGCPESFMSIWGGEPGVGKTRLAIKAGKKVNASTMESILYFNGEATEQDFRAWVGTDADPDLFHVVTATKIPVSRVCELAYRLRPRVIFIDSVQMLAEWDQGSRGQITALTVLRDLKADVRAGKPHIVCISQLNKAGDLHGTKMLEHLADLVAHVTKAENRKGVFVFEVPNKNRGGETPRGALFKHVDGTIECESTGEMRTTPLFKLVQPTENPVLAAGVVDPVPLGGGDDGEGGEAGGDDAGIEETAGTADD